MLGELFMSELKAAIIGCGTIFPMHALSIKALENVKLVAVCDIIEERAEKIMLAIPELDEEINKVAEGWKTNRMGTVELSILRLAVYELKHDDEIPEKVAINEAVELAKKFGGDEAPAFVNGILAKLV